MLYVGARIARGNENDIEAGGTLSKLKMLREKNLRRAGYPLLLARQDGPCSLFLGFPAFHLDERQMIPPLRDEIDFAALCFIALGKNLIALAFKELLRAAFSGNTNLICILACGVAAV